MSSNISERMFLASWPISVISLVLLVKHCYDTRHVSQKTFLFSKIGVLLGLLLSIPYNWDKTLMRYKLILSATLYIVVVTLLTYGVTKGKSSRDR